MYYTVSCSRCSAVASLRQQAGPLSLRFGFDLRRDTGAAVSSQSYGGRCYTQSQCYQWNQSVEALWESDAAWAGSLKAWISSGRVLHYLLFRLDSLVPVSFCACLSHIYYMCEDCPFMVTASCVTISNPNSLFISETRVNPGIRIWKALIWMSSMSESHWWYLFHKELKSWDSPTWFRIWKFQTQLESCIFKRISWLNGSLFEGDGRGFMKGGVKTYLMAPMSPLNSPTFFLSSHL